MKKSIFLAMLSAIVLTGTMTFTACSSEDAVEPNPTYDGNAVKTSFTISVGDVKSPTRMEADPVQQDEKFNGMTDIYLFPAKLASDATITGTTVTSESYINLPDFSSFSSQVASAQGKIYQDVAFSVGVNNFLFYAASALPGNGKLKASYLGMPATEFNGTNDWVPEPMLTTSIVNNIHFDLVPIQKEKTLADVKTAGATTIAPLNAVDAAITSQITAAGTGNIADELTSLQKVLRNDQSTTAGTHDYHPYAGSSLSQKALMTKIYTAVTNLNTTITDTYSAPILAAITTYFNVTGSATDGFTLTWKTDPKFPSDDTTLGVPDGAVAVQFNGTAFDFVEPSVDGMSVPQISNYVFPPSLYYTINTPSMVKDAEYLSSLSDQHPTWAAVKTAGGYTQGAITSATRSVIMKDQVQYAVGRLDVQVRIKPSATILDSGSKDLVDASNNPIPQPVTVPGGGYLLTGVLIGGQKNVDWAFLPTGNTEYTIWDNVMGNEIYAKQQTSYAGDNYTLALETEKATSEGVGKIKIALEFQNTGNDFYGIEHNIIPAGTKFYLVAELDPSTNTTYMEQDPENTTNEPNDTWDETDKLIKQVFKQDYVTTAKLTINETSLQKAYNVVPDLRSPKLEFGLSVDLHWRTGITFTQEF